MASPIPTQLSPGVNVSEIDLSQFVQPESLSSAGMVGTFNWGPALVATRVSTESSLAALFGKPTLDQSDTLSEDDFFAAANFLKYSNNLKVVRLLQDDDHNATTREPGIDSIVDVDHPSISNIEEFALFGGFSGQDGIESTAVFRARYPGNFGDSLKVVLFDGGSGTSEETTSVDFEGLIDYEVDGPNFIGITSGTIGLTLQVSHLQQADPTIPFFTILGTTFTSFNYYEVTLSIPDGIGDINSADQFAIAYATGTTTQNYSLMNSGNEPSGNRENYFRPFNYATGELFRMIGEQGAFGNDFTSYFTTKVSDGVYKILFLDADETNLMPSFKIGLTLSAFPNLPITNYTDYQVSGYPSGFVTVFSGLDGNGNFDWYRYSASKAPNKIFPDGVAPTTGVRGLAKFIAMTGGVSFNAWGDDGNQLPDVGVTFNTIGGLTGIRQDFTFGLKQFVYDGTYTVTTTTQTSGGAVSSPLFDKPPQTSAYAKSVGGSNDEISFAVVDTQGKFGPKNAILERFELLSKAVDAKNLNNESIYYKDYINYNSNYVYMTKPLGFTGGGNASSNATTAFGDIVQNYEDADGNARTRVGIYDANLEFGQSGITTPSLAEYTSAYKLFADDDYAVDILFLPESSVSNISVNNIETNLESMVYDTVIAPRKDTVFILPTPKPSSGLQHTADITTKTINYRNRLTVPSNSYTMLVAGRKVYFDTFNNQIRKMSLSSDLAGILSAQEIPWESPAGFARGNIRNAIKLETNFTKADRDELYKNGINFFVQFGDGAGTVLFGDKTLLKKPSAFDRINVRRVFIALEKAIAKASKYSLFEFNDEFTRSQFRNLVTPLLASVQAQRGITDFKVVCDETNNTAEVIDRNQFVADIYIKPAKSVNFIQLNFVAVRSDFNLTTLE
jgi:hypothetical protein